MPLSHPANRVDRRTLGRTIKDLLLYIAIAVLIVVSAILYADHQAKLGQPPGLPNNWLGFSIMTGLVFLNVFRSFRAHWRQRRFWTLLLPILILHFGAGFVVVSQLGNAGLVGFALAGLLEVFALDTYLNRFLIRK
jgi:hypothetical protein